MKYRITKAIVKHIASLNKDVKDCEAVEVGTGTPAKFSIWGDFNGFSTISFDSIVEGSIVAKEKNGYMSYTLYPERATTVNSAPNTGSRGGAMANVMATKQANIKESMAEKNEAIQKSASQRDAVLITVNFYPEFSDMEDDIKTRAIKEKLEYWREYFLTFTERTSDNNPLPPF